MTLGTDARMVSALYVLRQFAMLRRTPSRLKIAGGMAKLPRAMAADLREVIQYDAAVVRVERRTATEFKVDYEQASRLRTVLASRVILAIPLPTLRQIEMRPRFSAAKERIIDTVRYYPVVRVLLQTRTRFWNRGNYNGSARTARGTEVWDCNYERFDGKRGLLGASIGGEFARQADDLSISEAVAEGVEFVADSYPAVRNEFEKGTAFNWTTEPWSRGAFAVFSAGQMSASMPELVRSEQGVHLAGEHTSSWMGWMEGALESGERAAREVLAQP